MAEQENAGACMEIGLRKAAKSYLIVPETRPTSRSLAATPRLPPKLIAPGAAGALLENECGRARPTRARSNNSVLHRSGSLPVVSACQPISLLLLSKPGR